MVCVSDDKTDRDIRTHRVVMKCRWESLWCTTPFYLNKCVSFEAFSFIWYKILELVFLCMRFVSYLPVMLLKKTCDSSWSCQRIIAAEAIYIIFGSCCDYYVILFLSLFWTAFLFGFGLFMFFANDVFIFARIQKLECWSAIVTTSEANNQSQIVNLFFSQSWFCVFISPDNPSPFYLWFEFFMCPRVVSCCCYPLFCKDLKM